MATQQPWDQKTTQLPEYSTVPQAAPQSPQTPGPYHQQGQPQVPVGTPPTQYYAQPQPMQQMTPQTTGFTQAQPQAMSQPQQVFYNQQGQPQPQHVQHQAGIPMQQNPHVVQAHQQPQFQQGQQQQFVQPGAQPQMQTGGGGGRQYANVTPLASLSRSGAPVDCPACGQRGMTRTTYLAGNYAHAWAAGLCCLTGLFCFVPYIVDGFKNVDHNCGQCGVLLATWHRSGSVDVHQHT